MGPNSAQQKRRASSAKAIVDTLARSLARRRRTASRSAGIYRRDNRTAKKAVKNKAKRAPSKGHNPHRGGRSILGENAC
jgi:hypothetical protein